MAVGCCQYPDTNPDSERGFWLSTAFDASRARELARILDVSLQHAILAQELRSGGAADGCELLVAVLRWEYSDGFGKN